MSLSNDTKKTLGTTTLIVGGVAGFTGMCMSMLSLVSMQACFTPGGPFVGRELEQLKEFWTPGNTMGDFNISAASLLVLGFLIFYFADYYLDTLENIRQEAKNSPSLTG